MGMGRKDYEAIAGALREQVAAWRAERGGTGYDRDEIAGALLGLRDGARAVAGVLEAGNPLFDLEELAAEGYVIDEWVRWQCGGCGEYAAALIEWYGHLRLGVLLDEDGRPQHFFAHNDRWGYDSFGEHDLPYLWFGHATEVREDEDPVDWGLRATAEELHEVLFHVHRNGIVIRRPPEAEARCGS